LVLRRKKEAIKEGKGKSSGKGELTRENLGNRVSSRWYRRSGWKRTKEEGEFRKGQEENGSRIVGVSKMD